jgi:transposase
MDAAASNPRQERGLALAKAKGKRIKQIAGDKWHVPSQTAETAGYVVDAASGECTCLDYETRHASCKHVFALQYIRHELTMPDGSTVVTEGIRFTYSQDWPRYNAAQCAEESTVKVLLHGLCDGVQSLPYKGTGRRPVALRDVLYGATMKVYGTMSGRRSTTDLRACEDAGHVEHAAHYNSIFRYVEKPELLPLLKTLVEQSAAPLKAVERTFAADATGFATPTYVRWFDYKHGEDRRVQQWVKCHAMVGTLTNVITAVEATPGHVNDSPMFASLVERTAANGFDMREVSADKAYLSHANLAAVEKVGAVPFVPFKSNSGSSGSEAWERMYHYFALNRETFLSHYHLRSNSESTFSAMKRKFGASLRSKAPAAQLNEVLLKCLCFNLSMVVHAIHELGIEPRFWQPQAVNA